jgi:hypothetical protein
MAEHRERAIVSKDAYFHVRSSLGRNIVRFFEDEISAFLAVE